MRVIEHKMLQAIKSRKCMRCGNTEVCSDDNYSSVWLHNNKIAEIHNDCVVVMDAGWQTVTTKSRINAILRAYNLPTVYAKKYVWYVGDSKWHGSYMGSIQ